MIANILLGILIVSFFISITGVIISMTVSAFKDGEKGLGIFGIVLTVNFVILYLMFVAYQLGV